MEVWVIYSAGVAPVSTTGSVSMKDSSLVLLVTVGGVLEVKSITASIMVLPRCYNEATPAHSKSPQSDGSWCMTMTVKMILKQYLPSNL